MEKNIQEKPERKIKGSFDLMKWEIKIKGLAITQT
jgi:hypothetical protein